jgi:hypothetical protein
MMQIQLVSLTLAAPVEPLLFSIEDFHANHLVQNEGEEEPWDWPKDFA